MDDTSIRVAKRRHELGDAVRNWETEYAPVPFSMAPFFIGPLATSRLQQTPLEVLRTFGADCLGGTESNCCNRFHSRSFLLEIVIELNSTEEPI